MNSDPDDKDLIERYILKKLTDSEMQLFNNRLEENREFARKFRMIKMFPEMMSEQGRHEFLEINSDVPEKTIKKSSSHFLRHLLLGFITIIIIGGIVIVIFIIINNRGKENSINEVIKTENAVKSVIKVEEVPEKIDPNSLLDKPIDKPAFKSGFNFLSPANGAIIPKNDMILFKWENKADTFIRMYVIAEPDKRIILWRGIRPGLKQFEIPGLYLKPGKYSWYIGTNSITNSFEVRDN